MATKKETELIRLNAELVEVRSTISKIRLNGQSFQKGGRSGFSVDMAKLPELRKMEKELLTRISTWENYDG